MNKLLKLLGWGCAVLIVTVIANISGNYLGKSVSKNSIPKKILKEDVSVVVVKQNNPGITEEMLDKKTLLELEVWLFKTLKSKFNQSIKAQGINPEKYEINHEINSSYVERDGRKLAVFKMSIKYGSNLGTNIVRIMGVEKKYLVWVSCIKETPEPIFVWSGACGEKIKEIHGVSFTK